MPNDAMRPYPDPMSPPPLPGSDRSFRAGRDVPPIPQAPQHAQTFGAGMSAANGPAGAASTTTMAPAMSTGPVPPFGSTPQPRRRSGLGYLGAGVIGFVAGGLVTGVGLLTLGAVMSAQADPQPIGGRHTVVLEVTSDDASSARLDYGTAGSHQSKDGVSLPFSKTVDVTGSPFATLSASVDYKQSATLHCKVTVDGKIVTQQDADGNGARVGCDYFPSLKK